MKKMLMGVALAVVAMFAMSSVASANYTAARGTAVSARGRITLAGNIITTACDVTLGGTISGPLAASVTSSSATCSAGTLALTTPFTKSFLVNSRGALTGEWAAGPFTATVNTGLGIVCVYTATLAGRYTTGSTTVLTLNGTLQSVVLNRGASSDPFGLCTTSPVISGSLTLNTATA